MVEAANKIAVVTGAGTGVGRAASLALMNAGFTVVLAGRRMEMLEETKKLGDNVGKSLCVSADMADTGLTKATNLDGRMYDIAVGQVDIGNAATPMTDRMVDGVLQPDGRKMPEPRMDAKAVGDAVAYMASLPLDANVLFMTVMASKMPFVGRG